jgi:hypothetical protein
MRRRSRSLVLPAVVAAAMLARVALVSSRHMAPFLDGEYDDQLFARQAAAILNREWLGPYDHLTLAKGPGYPLFIALSHRLHLRLPIAEALLWCTACGITLVAIISFGFSRPACYAAFLFLLFDPISYAAVFDRLIRERFAMTLTLVVLAGGIGLLAAGRRERGRGAWGWGAGSGSGSRMAVDHPRGNSMAGSAPSNPLRWLRPFVHAAAWSLASSTRLSPVTTVRPISKISMSGAERSVKI